jgi:tetratricopeptide (TPR) repeat protein
MESAGWPMSTERIETPRLSCACLSWLGVVLCACTLLSRTTTAQSASNLASRAAQAMQSEDYAEAEKLFLRLTEAAPDVPEMYSNLGLAQYYEKKPELARRAFAKSLSMKSNLFVPNFYLAKINCEEGKYAEALPLLRKAVDLQPQEPASRSLLAEVLSLIGSRTEAITQYQELVRQQPGDTNARYQLVRAYLDEAHRLALLLKSSDARFTLLLKAESDSTLPEWDTAALEEWNKAFSDMPAIPGIRIPFADFLSRTSRLSHAEAVLQKELEIDPFSFRARFGLAELSLRKGDLEGAIDNLNQAARIQPQFFNPLPPLSLPAERSETMYETLKAMNGESDFGRAFVMTEVARKLALGEDGVRWQRVTEERRDELELKIKAHMRTTPAPANREQRRILGLKYLREKRLDEGLRLLMPMMKAGRADSQVRVSISRGLFEERRLQEVAAFLEAAQMHDAESLYLLVSSYRTLATEEMNALAKIDPQSVDLQKLVAESFVDRKMYKEAADQYRSALQVRPDDPDLYFGLGEACFDQMEFDEAAQAYGHSIELKPSDPAFYVMRASALVELGKAEEAVSLAKRALELNPNLLQAHVSLGRALALMGNDREAVQELEKAAGTDNDGMLHYALFKLYRRLGRTQDANRALQVSNGLRRRSAAASEQN